MFCLPDIRPVFFIKGKYQNTSVGFLCLCTLFSTTTQMQGLNAKLRSKPKRVDTEEKLTNYIAD